MICAGVNYLNYCRIARIITWCLLLFSTLDRIGQSQSMMITGWDIFKHISCFIAELDFCFYVTKQFLEFFDLKYHYCKCINVFNALIFECDSKRIRGLWAAERPLLAELRNTRMRSLVCAMIYEATTMNGFILLWGVHVINHQLIQLILILRK